MGRKLDHTLAVLNGTIGQFLHRSGNGLATEMELVEKGQTIPLTTGDLTAAYPAATRRVVLLVHGIMCTESVWQFPDGTDYGTRLAQDAGYTPLYLRYNSGRAIADNGMALARLLEQLVDAYPAPLAEILLLGFSMGGLVVRSACHVGAEEDHRWVSLVKRAMYIGTPHLGAPLERAGRFVTQILREVGDPYARMVGDIADLRSDGMKDLGHADLRHMDRAKTARERLASSNRHEVPLLPHVRHYLVAGSLSNGPYLGALLGDALVPVRSATDGQCADPRSTAFPPDHVKVLRGMGHMTLAHHSDVYREIRAWCEES